MVTKVIGYQITNLNQDIPFGLHTYQLFKTAEQAFNYLREHKLNKGLPASQCWFVKEYYEGDIEEPLGGSLADYGACYEHIDLLVKVAAEIIFKEEEDNDSIGL